VTFGKVIFVVVLQNEASGRNMQLIVIRNTLAQQTILFGNRLVTRFNRGSRELTFSLPLRSSDIRVEVASMKCSSRVRSSDTPRWKITNSQHGHDWSQMHGDCRVIAVCRTVCPKSEKRRGKTKGLQNVECLVAAVFEVSGPNSRMLHRGSD
jgi:hypothetical protein